MFGKSCPFLLCFIVLFSDIENIIAITTCNVVLCDGVLIYNTPISFMIGNCFEFDIVFLLLILLVSFSIETCIYNKTAIFYLILILYRKSYFETHDAFSDNEYICILVICALISMFYILKGMFLANK